MFSKIIGLEIQELKLEELSKVVELMEQAMTKCLLKHQIEEGHADLSYYETLYRYTVLLQTEDPAKDFMKSEILFCMAKYHFS